MILREFAGTDQCPYQLAQTAFAVVALGQNALHFLELLAVWRPAERSQIELFHNLLVRGAGLEQTRQAAVRPAQTLDIGGSSQHMESLAEVRFRVPFRNGAAIGASVKFKEAREERVGIPKLDGARAGWGLADRGSLGDCCCEGFGHAG